jgi:alpha-N-arabinofuranosidase
VLGNLLITLLKNSDRVASASLAQLVNVIAPIMTEPGGDAWRQTTFYPFSITSRLASGTVLRPVIDSPRYETEVYGEVDVIDSVATWDEESGRGAVFLVNRDLTESRTVSIAAGSLGAAEVLEAVTVTDADAYAKNTLADQNRVTPSENGTASVQDGVITVTLPPVSWTAISFSN